MTAIHVDVIPVTRLQQNCMLIWTEEGGPAVVVDPGGDVDAILAAIERRRARVEGILVTHGHSDHIGGLPELAKAVGRAAWYHPADLWLFERGRAGRPIELPEGSVPVGDGDGVELAGLTFDVLHTPGHTPGSVSFRTDGDGRTLLFCGDLLFLGSIGRTDMPRGDFGEIVRSIADKAFTLPDDTLVLPGHGPPTTIGHERETNPFVGTHALKDLGMPPSKGAYR